MKGDRPSRFIALDLIALNWINGLPGIRTRDQSVKSRMLYH